MHILEQKRITQNWINIPLVIHAWSFWNKPIDHHGAYALPPGNMAAVKYNIPECSLCFYGNQWLSSY